MKTADEVRTLVSNLRTHFSESQMENDFLTALLTQLSPEQLYGLADLLHEKGAYGPWFQGAGNHNGEHTMYRATAGSGPVLCFRGSEKWIWHAGRKTGEEESREAAQQAADAVLKASGAILVGDAS